MQPRPRREDPKKSNAERKQDIIVVVDWGQLAHLTALDTIRAALATLLTDEAAAQSSQATSYCQYGGNHEDEEQSANLPTAKAAATTRFLWLLLLLLLLWRVLHLDNLLIYFAHPANGIDVPAAGSPEGGHIVLEGDRIVQEEDRILAEGSHHNYIQADCQHVRFQSSCAHCLKNWQQSITMRPFSR